MLAAMLTVFKLLAWLLDIYSATAAHSTHKKMHTNTKSEELKLPEFSMMYYQV